MMWTSYLSVALLSVIQIQDVMTTNCDIESVMSPSASTLKVAWNSYAGASQYILDLRVVNSTTVAPVVVMLSSQITERLVQGLKPGLDYLVTLKVFVFYQVVCTDTEVALTVPATSQITFSKAISSTSIQFEWSSVVGADSYILVVEELLGTQKLNQTFTTLAGQVDNLTPSTTYICYILSSNSAGRGAKGRVKSILTLVQPPTDVSLEVTGKSSARVTWTPVDKVLLYQVKVSDVDSPSNSPVIRNTSSTSLDISGLEPCSNYTVGVSSVNVFLVPGEPAEVTHSTSTIKPVSSISVDYSCSSGMMTVAWTDVFGANSYRASAVDGTGASLNCTTPSSSCQITMLECGEKYSVYVWAISDDCESISNTSYLLETVPCAPVQLETSYTCSSNVIVFGWQATNNTSYYVATSEDETGTVKECRTVESQCHFTNAACGQYYKYQVYAVSTECDSAISQPVFIRTAPCLPTNVKTSAECQSNNLTTSWDSVAGALSYTVEAHGNDGKVYNCSSASNSCVVNGVPCGEHLSVWIVASNDNCSTPRVLGEAAQTVPCTPTNVTASANCSQDSATVTWVTGRGAIFYIAIAEDENGKAHSCHSVGSSCVMDDLSCGKNYYASVIGTNLKCNSSASQQVAFTTAPCPPTAIEALRDCEANQALIVWQNHQSAGLYTATMEDQSGAQLNCTSDTVNNCKIPALPCGKTYNVAVSYSDGYCSSVSTPVSMESVPCGPEDVSAAVSCLTGELEVTWSIPVPAENYTATISTGMAQPLYCTSTDTRCTKAGLQCGSSYTVAVVAVTGTCHSLPSPEVTVQTVPCPPSNVVATKTCLPNPVPVSWSASDGATHYTVVAVSSGGFQDDCATNTTSCSLSELQCGETYTISVSAADDNCTSQLSETVYSTEPCVPSIVSSSVLCTTSAAVVTWTTSPTATSYTVTVDGTSLTCGGSGDNCVLSNLVCDESYQIRVSATDGACTTANSDPYLQSPVPCAPSDLSVNLVCGTNDIMASWQTSSEPLDYVVTAEAENLTPVTCSTSGSSCSPTGLQCGQTYSVYVMGYSDTCSGLYSSTETVSTGPCPPQDLSVQSDCGTNSLKASWSASAGATSYTASVTGPGGFSETCSPSSSSNLECQVANLQCATEYTVTVTAADSVCTSTPTQASVVTGPCDPTNLSGVLNCGSDSASVSWASAAGAVAYTVLATEEASGHSTSCRDTTTTCQLTQLQCGKTYSLTVFAEDATCNSTGATSTVLMTAPCAPSVHSSSLICGTNSSLLFWTPVADATGYAVNAVDSSGREASCASASTSASDSCTLADLQCSETYVVTVTARGSQCDSAPGPSATITTAPCPPAITSKEYDCDANTATVSWSRPAGSLSFDVQLAGEDYQDSHQTTSGSHVFGDLPCGLEFNVTVVAQGAQCSSGPSVCHALETVPCPPTQVNASQVCSNRSALVTWVGSPSAVGYNVTATGQDGHTHVCNTTSTGCEVPDVHCGETYDVTVTPYSQSCTGNPSAPRRFTAGLCAPGNLAVAAACQHNTVSWTHVAGADMYVATATAQDGHADTCSSNSANSCDFTSLRCGETYAVTVVTVDDGCSSEPSSPVDLTTALCPPTDVASWVNCEDNTVTLTWAPVAGAAYVVQKELLGGAPSPSEHATPDATHTMSDLLCGRRYAFRVAAKDGTCLSIYSAPTEVSTAPCQPTNLTARVDCGTNKANFSWAQSSGAESYIVEVTGEHGHVASCSSNGTSCAVKLRCGRTYTATLVASTESCNSTKHTDIHFESAPCLPEDVNAVLDCNSNVMNVTWTESFGSDDYTAWAISTDDHRASCNSTSNSCSIHDLQCGKIYEVAVTSSSIHCQSIAGSDYTIQSAPCKPEDVTVKQNCSSNALTVNWNQGATGQNYTVHASSASGVNDTCESAESSCSFLELSCGQHYTFTVTGHTNVCMSESSTPAEKYTAPCPPSAVSAELNCTTGQALVSWSTAAAAMGYTAVATSTDGHSDSCSENGTSCYLSNLACGQQYSVVVEAMDTGCPGPASGPASLITEPCAPENVSVHYNVTTGVVRWNAASGASSYLVQAVTDQSPTVSCDNTGPTSCSLSGLQCGHVYDVTVTAGNEACDSATSETSQLKTEPCPPTNVQATSECGQLAATVSWQQSDLAVGYVAYAENGQSLSCHAEGAASSCVVGGLTCGTTYSVWVKALGEQHNSSESSVVSVTSEPCQPSGIAAVVDCEAGSATVSWQSGAGALRYEAELTASSGHTASCSSAGVTNCEPSSPQCGEEYSVSVKAVGESCNSTAHMAGYLTTEPCLPTDLSIHYNMTTTKVTWGSTPGASSYRVLAVTDQGLNVTCNTSDTHCLLDATQCGQIYDVTVTAGNEACDHTATSEPSRLTTEPCPPANVQASVDCESRTASVSWERSELAVGYVAYLDNQEGHQTSCESSDADTFCDASGLVCGTTYSVWAKAIGEQYNSSDSPAVSVTSAPCLPTDVSVDVSCESDGAAVVSWSPAHGSANISLTADVSGSLQTLCTTPHNSCDISGLSCGESFSLSLTATNEQCSVTSPTQISLNTRPCPPQRVAASLECGSATAVLSWEEQPEVEMYKGRAVKASGGEAKMCNSTGSTCQFANLVCGETYNITVTAQIGACYSQDSNTVFIQTEPCQPVIVSAEAPCQSADAQISWQQASGVETYLVTAKGSLGFMEIYNTTQTLLSASLPCGQKYNVTVLGRGSECDSAPSSPAYFKTTPCVPWNVTTYIQCEANTGAVSWGPSDGAESYIAVATGLDGHAHECPTNDTWCTWDDLHCGEEYTVTVKAKDGDCTSLTNNSAVIHMDPCVPQSLSADVNCEQKVVSLSWAGNDRTKLYNVSAVGGGTSVSFTTNITTAQFSDFTCGQSYNLTVTPSNQHCSGDYSATTSVQTWPCSPAGVDTTQDCLSGIVMVTWQPADGTDYYMATLQVDGGVPKMCMSETSECSVPDLMCGYNYSVSVTAANQQCNVTSSDTTSLRSVPCVPTDVSVAMSCGNNAALVSWSASRGAVQYSVTAVSSHGNDSWVTSDLRWSLDNLECGSSYTVQVMAVDDDCSSTPSQAVTFDSAPCPPQDVSTQVNCSTNDVTISWNTVRDADHFLVSLTAANGEAIEPCNTTNAMCVISNVSCGSTFSVQVTSVRGDCSSEHGQPLSLQSAPCQPQGVRGDLDCVTNSAWISWDAAAGADRYTVSAVGEEGQIANCTTSTNTTCEVEDLACGVSYNFSVTAENSECESPASAAIDLQTAPCSLAAITAITQCHNSSILVTWETMEGGEGNTMYTATAEASDHTTFLSCNGTGTSCYLQGAQCGLRYTVIVAASSDSCSSMRSPPYRVSMEPCPPTDVTVQASCEDGNASVSWTPSPVATSYHVVATTAHGHMHTCNSTSNNCSVSGLHCDQQYTVFVTASHENCSSKASQNATLYTGPCQPTGLSVTYSCNDQSAALTWTPSDNAEDYYGRAQAVNGHMLYCHSKIPSCTIDGLDCGAVYSFSVKASDGTCNSSYSDPLESGAAPCPPDAVEVRPLLTQNDIQVLSFSWSEVTCGDTEYLLWLTGSLLGDSQALFQLNSFWTSLTTFEMPLPCGSTYSATVESRNGGGSSEKSAALTGTTAPCPPAEVVYSGDSSSATVSWSASVFATYYTVFDNSVTPKVQLCNTTQLSCSLSNIASSDLVVTASNAGGESEEATVTRVISQGRRRRDLSDQTPGNVPKIQAKLVMSTVSHVEWSPIGTASNYMLAIRKQGSPAEDQTLTVFGESFILTDLSPNSNYCFSVRADGPESELVCVQTGDKLAQDM